MLVVISPAKRLDWSECAGVTPTDPRFQEDAVTLARAASRLSRKGLRNLMSISDDLAKLNQARFKAFQPEPEPIITRPAMLAFAGDTYLGLDAPSLDHQSTDWAQGHLRILSGLYGVLRPLDRIQPYRLEMGSRLKTRKGPSLYAYWGTRLAETLNVDAAETGSRLLVNCASKEYFDAVDRDALELTLVTPVFLEEKGGEQKIVSFFAKKARGAMARFVIDNRISTAEGLRDFDLGGYALDEAQSTLENPVFVRPEDARAEAA